MKYLVACIALLPCGAFADQATDNYNQWQQQQHMQDEINAQQQRINNQQYDIDHQPQPYNPMIQGGGELPHDPSIGHPLYNGSLR